MGSVMGPSWSQASSGVKTADRRAAAKHAPSRLRLWRALLKWSVGALATTAVAAPASAQSTRSYPAQGYPAQESGAPSSPQQSTTPYRQRTHPRPPQSQPAQRSGQPSPNDAPVPVPGTQPRAVVPYQTAPQPYRRAQQRQSPSAPPARDYYYPQRVPAASPQVRPRATAPTTRPSTVPWPYSGGLPPVIPYRDGQPVPPGYRLESSGGSGLIAAGLIMGGVVYGASLVYAANAGFENGTGWLVVPVVGPWAAIGSRKIPCTSKTVELKCIDAAGKELRAVAYLTADGLFQAMGLTLLLAGTSAREQQLVRQDVAKVQFHPRSYGKDGFGLDAVGRF